MYMKRIIFMRRTGLGVIAILFFTSFLYGNEQTISRESIREGLEAVYSLDYAKAWKIFDRLREEHAESPVVYAMLALTAYNELLFETRNLAVFQYGIPTPFDDTRPPAEFFEQKQERFLDANKTLLNVCERLIKKNPQDPLALYFQGMAYENLAMQTITLYGKRAEAADFAMTAGKIHRKALKLDPSLVDAETSTAVPEYVVGTLPFGFRWLGLLSGIRGDKKGAMHKLQEVADKGIYRASDALLVMGILNAWRGDAKTAVSIFSRMREIYPRNFLLDVSLADAYEEAMDDPMSAIGIYRELLKDLPAKASGIFPGEIYLRIGKNYARLRNYDLALKQFQKALVSSQRNLETEPLIYYNMALIYEKLGDKKQARECYQHVADFSGPTQLIEEQFKRARKKIK
jgi:tetratricopeptide (TPR) repeat protein